MEIRKEQFENLVPIQIIGTQRSGSNLLRVMLNQLDQAFAPHPPHILKVFHSILDYYGDLTDNLNYYSLVEDICEFVEINPVPWINRFLDPETIIKYNKNRTLFSIYKKVYEINAIANKGKFWFNKSMYNVHFLDLFEENSFEPYLIHLIRDGRDVSLSFKKAIVGHKHIYHLANQWNNDQEIANHYIQKYTTKKAIQIKYEDLLTQPKVEINKICNLIGMPYSNNILKYYESADSMVTADSGEMWQNLSKPLLTHNFNKYKKELSVNEIEIFENVAGKMLINYGYGLENVNQNRKSEYSAPQIGDFDKINERLKKDLMGNTQQKDLMKRHEQLKFIQEIYRKRNIPMEVVL